MKRFYPLALLLTLHQIAPAQTVLPFSVDDVLSAPYCSNLRAGRSRVAWVVTTKGVRTTWTATIPGGKPTRLAFRTTDGGQDPGELRFSPDDQRTEVLILPDEVHRFLLHKNWFRTYKAMDAFFGKHLLNQPAKTLMGDK